MRILLICDLDNWILGEIARQLSKYLGGKFTFLVLVSHSKNFTEIFRKVQTDYDIVHFLSPWDFFDNVDLVIKPCVVNLWHMVNWEIFDKNVTRIDTLLVGSDQWKNWCKNHIPSSLPLIRMPYGLDTNRFFRYKEIRKQFITENHLPEDVIIFGIASSGWSNEGNRKGVDRLWTCLTEIKTRSPQIPFIIRFIGRNWSKSIIPNNLTENTFFDLDLSEDTIPLFYSTLDYYVCTSRQEGVPYPVIEAMSCECTVLSTEVGIVPEIIENNRNGFLLREDDLINDFYNSIISTYKNKKLRNGIGLAARETITKSFEWADIIDNQLFWHSYESAIYFYKQRSQCQKNIYKLNNFLFLPRRIFIRLKDIIRISVGKILKYF